MNYNTIAALYGDIIPIVGVNEDGENVIIERGNDPEKRAVLSHDDRAGQRMDAHRHTPRVRI